MSCLIESEEEEVGGSLTKNLSVVRLLGTQSIKPSLKTRRRRLMASLPQDVGVNLTADGSLAFRVDL